MEKKIVVISVLGGVVQQVSTNDASIVVILDEADNDEIVQFAAVVKSAEELLAEVELTREEYGQEEPVLDEEVE